MLDRSIRTVSLAIPLIAVAAAAAQPFVDARLLFFDQVVAAEVSGVCCRTYYGLFSTLGLFMWIATAVTCLFTAAVLLRVNGATAAALFATAAAGLSGWLGFDDAFLFHENLGPKLGIPQIAILAVYPIATALYLIGGYRTILRGDLVLFGLALAFLATSMAVDVVVHSPATGAIVVEDGAKFAGIACWFVFHLQLMAKLIVQDAVGGTRTVRLRDLRPHMDGRFRRIPQ